MNIAIAIVGSRDFEDEAIIRHTLLRLQQKHGDYLVIVSGGARGADIIGETIAKELHISTDVHLPQWNVYGKSAGFKRNELIVRDADMVIAFFAPGPKSKGTAHTVAAARIKGIPVHIYHEGEWS